MIRVPDDICSRRRSRWNSICVLLAVGLCTQISNADPTAVSPGSVQSNERSSIPSNGPGDETSGPTTSERRRNPTLRLSDTAELDQLIELYMAGNYDQCSTQLGVFLRDDNADRFTDPEVVERGRLYYATCSLLLGEREQARLSLRAALEDNPLMPSPDSLTFPPPLVSLFLEVRDDVQQLIANREREQVFQLRRENEVARRKVEERRMREEQLAKLAAYETVVRTNSRFVASLPLGAGQFQNGNFTLGTLFLVGQSLAVVTALTTLAISESIEKRTKNESPDADRYDQYNRQMQALYQTMKWSTYTALGLYAISVLDAQLRFKPEIRLAARKRNLPPELTRDETAPPPVQSGLSWMPSFGVLHKGAFISAVGTF